jgi:hypothetical protein
LRGVTAIPFALLLKDCGTIVIGMKKELVTEAAVNLRVLRFDGESPAAQVDGFLDPAGICQHIGEVAQGRGVVWLERKDAEISIFGLVEAA